MKHYIITLLIASFWIASNQKGYGQDSLRDRIAQKKQTQQDAKNENEIPYITVRAQMRNSDNTTNLGNASWIRYIYRFLDLNKEKNAALYNPVTPIENRTNLYTLIFRLMAENKLNAFDFNNSQDIFSEQYRITPEEMFKRLSIPYSIEGNTITYDAYNVPSNEVLGYYIKEAWYFDLTNSVLDVKVEAICPILFKNDIDGYFLESAADGIREPQFWIPYQNIQPYLARMPIMTSNLNNILDKTIDDYFILRLYDGEIYKTMNMENKLLIEQYKTPEEVEVARQKIEEELNTFGKDLWVIGDSTKVSNGNPVKRNVKKKPDGHKGSSNASNSARERRLQF